MKIANQDRRLLDQSLLLTDSQLTLANCQPLADMALSFGKAEEAMEALCVEFQKRFKRVSDTIFQEYFGNHQPAYIEEVQKELQK